MQHNLKVTAKIPRGGIWSRLHIQAEVPCARLMQSVARGVKFQDASLLDPLPSIKLEAERLTTQPRRGMPEYSATKRKCPPRSRDLPPPRCRLLSSCCCCCCCCCRCCCCRCCCCRQAAAPSRCPPRWHWCCCCCRHRCPGIACHPEGCAGRTVAGAGLHSWGARCPWRSPQRGPC